MALKILVVDDAAFIRDTIKRTLRQFLHPLELHEAVDGRRAVAQLRGNKFDLILSDWEMPEMSGEQLLRWVRSESNTPEIPFIMISSRGDRDHIVKAIGSGVSDYLSKPFTPEELQRKVIKHLKKMGYVPPVGSPSAAQNSGFSSLEVLTASGPSNTENGSANSGTGRKPSDKSTATAFKGRAQLRFANLQADCVVRELSLQSLSGFMVRGEVLPTLFDPAVVDLSTEDGEALARVNGYVHSLQAVENHPETLKMKITIRFVDNDPEKFETISKVIAGG
ncbi:response regulator [Teredinibacter waterburyi]|jgi:Response regulator containing a CheY-like receiver domain and a GGDEF domain|uniref:response regulator n=1 Tax=Teredinibacter waterburyi TaxID=1500538 RepID=UPI00165FA5A4|nr:response regulator [Teredinibacter waterburyi]